MLNLHFIQQSIYSNAQINKKVILLYMYVLCYINIEIKNILF